MYEEPEKPGNALEFFQQHLTAEGPATSDMEALKKENGELKARVEEVRRPWRSEAGQDDKTEGGAQRRAWLGLATRCSPGPCSLHPHANASSRRRSTSWRTKAPRAPRSNKLSVDARPSQRSK